MANTLRSKREDVWPAAKILHTAGFNAAIVDGLADYIGKPANDAIATFNTVGKTADEKKAAKAAAAHLLESDARFAIRSNRGRGF